VTIAECTHPLKFVKLTHSIFSGGGGCETCGYGGNPYGQITLKCECGYKKIIDIEDGGHGEWHSLVAAMMRDEDRP
jgi:hypothetical protein